MAPTDGARALIYCRISRDREGAGLGIQRQLEDCTALAESLGLTVVGIHEDNDLSAYSGKPRPGYRQLLDDLRAGRADIVLAWHTDRLHRSPAELEQYIDVCEPRRIDTRTVKAGHLDLSTATGRMIARQLGVQARYEVERMVERQRRARDQMAQKGKHFGGRRPFGWEADGVTTNEFERSLIAEAADAVLAGASLRSIAAGWNARDITTSTGAEWTGPELGSMLRRARNAGIRVHRGQEVGPGAWEPAIPEPKWRSLVAVLNDPSRRVTPGNERKYLGSNLYLCGMCGATVRASTAGTGPGKKHWPAYRCRTGRHVTRRRDLLDDWVQLAILERLSRPDALDLLAEREDPVDVRAAQAELREARATLDELAKGLGRGELDMRSWTVASAAARARLESAEKTMSHAVKVNPVVGLVGAEDPEAAWKGLDLSRQRAVIAYLMTVTVLPARKGRIPGGGYWDPDAVRIDWK
ncbi:recombinase family protein [Streptomyces sp. HNM0645]|uniref:recombinase family protein n=1 Tax=Streptomyces sp. HNM0645 TaxID=2782343 RepID=UPI0024B7EE8F|nr:recombinase family protein [Streptomyces sp. HNM0645]MDI9885298.1 recombinase family protein [Streptomyces sp. HNM0645]